MHWRNFIYYQIQSFTVVKTFFPSYIKPYFIYFFNKEINYIIITVINYIINLKVLYFQ